MSALDDSCVLFAVKEHQSNPMVNVASDCSSSPQSQVLQSPNPLRNFFDQSDNQPVDFQSNNSELLAQLAQRLSLIENQENIP